MSARDIDLTYAEDGRTLQQRSWSRTRVVQLPGEGQARPAHRRQDHRHRDGARRRDGDQPQRDRERAGRSAGRRRHAGEADPRRRRSRATGAPGAGSQNATFAGNVDYRESRGRARQARRRSIARPRPTRSIVADQAGLRRSRAGRLPRQRALHGRRHRRPSAPMRSITSTQDRLDLSPGDGDTGPPAARHRRPRHASTRATIELALTSPEAEGRDTNVRSSMMPQQAGSRRTAAGRGDVSGAAAQRADDVPSMLKQDQPVNVTSNRLDYDGAAARDYNGNARLWQGDTEHPGRHDRRRRQDRQPRGARRNVAHAR